METVLSVGLSNAIEHDNNIAIPVKTDCDFISDVNKHPCLCALFLWYKYIKSSVINATEHVGIVLNGKCVGFTIAWCINSSKSNSGIVHPDKKDNLHMVESNNEIYSRDPFIEASPHNIKDGNADDIAVLILS